MTSKGHQVFCTINGKPCFSFSKGMRIVSDFKGKVLELVGIDTRECKAFVKVQGKSDSMTVAPNAIYTHNVKWTVSKEVPFYKPANK